MKKRMKKIFFLLLTIYALLTIYPSDTSIFPIPESPINNLADNLEEPDIRVYHAIHTTPLDYHTPAHTAS